MRDDEINNCILKGIEWIKQWEGSETRKLEALWIINGILIKRGKVDTIKIYRQRLKRFKTYEKIGFIPSKYGGNIGSVIYTSEAAGLCYDTILGSKYSDWVINNQNKKGMWTETITEYFPRNKSWYFTKSLEYWVTATVIINMQDY